MRRETEFFQPPCEGGKDKGAPFAAPLVRGVKLGFFALFLNMSQTNNTSSHWFMNEQVN